MSTTGQTTATAAIGWDTELDVFERERHCYCLKRGNLNKRQQTISESEYKSKYFLLVQKQ
ncbi:MAG: hypothetical protein CL913_09480 [Deltaproteobacteria bacterium]|nr:hypothetical protein [Deltaproteobacteria bacterium]